MEISRTYNPQPNLTSFAQKIEEVGKQRLKLSWGTIHDAVDALAYMVSPYKPSLIVGVSRGGLIPATLLSHKLNIPMAAITVSAYEGTRRTLQKPIRVKDWKDEYDSCNTLVVDDIIDSGDTLAAITYRTDRLSPQFIFACLMTKRIINSKGVHFFGNVPKDVWVQFPWEQEET